MIARLIYQAAVRILHFTGFYRTRNQRYVEFISRLVQGTTMDGQVLVDVGCGPGILTSMLPHSYRILGVDLNHELLTSLAQDRVEKIQARAERLPLRTEAIDLLLAISLIEHIRDRAVFLREVHRVLRPNGVAILQIPELGYPLEPHTKWPFLRIWNTSLQRRILSVTGHDSLELSTSLDEVVDAARRMGLLPETTLPIWHFKITKLFKIPQGYFVLFRKSRGGGSAEGAEPTVDDVPHPLWKGSTNNRIP